MENLMRANFHQKVSGRLVESFLGRLHIDSFFNGAQKIYLGNKHRQSAKWNSNWTCRSSSPKNAEIQIAWNRGNCHRKL